MADFAEYGEIISRCMGYPNRAFLEAYYENLSTLTDEAIAGHPVSSAIMYLMRDKTEWKGSVSTLFVEIEIIASQLAIDTHSRIWPKAPNSLSRRLNEVKTNLRTKGIEIEQYIVDTKAGLRGLRITRKDVPGSDSESGSNSGPDHSTSDSDSDASKSDFDDSPPDLKSSVIYPQNPQNRQNLQNHAQDKSKNSDDIIGSNKISSDISSENLAQNRAQNPTSVGSVGSDDIIRTLQSKVGIEEIPNQVLDTEAEIEARRLKMRALYWSGSKWYCKNCRQSGDKFHMAGHICNFSKNPNEVCNLERPPRGANWK